SVPCAGFRSLPEAHTNINSPGCRMHAGKVHLNGLFSLSVRPHPSISTGLSEIFLISIQSENSPSSSMIVTELDDINSDITTGGRSCATAGTRMQRKGRRDRILISLAR